LQGRNLNNEVWNPTKEMQQINSLIDFLSSGQIIISHFV